MRDAVDGESRKHKKLISESSPKIVPVPENPPTDPVQKPLSLSLTTGLPAGTPKLIQETSIAATTCANEDRWVFMQDVAGNIRAAEYSTSNSSWTFATEQYNFTSAKLGTPLSASCVNITEDVGLDLGTYVSEAGFIRAEFPTTSRSPFL